jgi:hypothetical protein
MPSSAQAIETGVDMATSAAVAVAAAQRRVLDYFFAQNAVMPEKAQPFITGRRLQQKQFDRMRNSGVIREAKPGLYYVDIPTWHAWRANISKRIVLLILFLVLAFMIAMSILLPHGK